MKIDKIVLYHINLPLREPFITWFGKIDVRETLIIGVHSWEYIWYGESALLSVPMYTSEYLEWGKNLLIKHILPRFIGKEIFDPKEIRNIYKDIKWNNIAKAGIEMAIWDLCAKEAWLPLYKYLWAQRNYSEVGISIWIQKDITSLMEKIEKELKEWYKRIKIKIKPGMDRDILENIRKNYPDIYLMVDANSSYILDDIADLQKMDTYNLMMIEQPLWDQDILDHSFLQKKLKTPICLDESIHTYDDARKAIQIESCKIINIKPGRLWGIGETLEIHDLCKEKNIPLWVWWMLESGVGKIFLDHIATLPWFILPWDNVPQEIYFIEDICTGNAFYKDWIMTLSERPWIWIEIDKEKLEKYIIDTIII